jgi:DNA-binding MarR family transcriptional regulator
LRFTYLAVARELDADLRAAHRLPLSEFDLLRALSNPGCGQRMAGLAGSVGLSPSGLTRAIERLERRGLVRRVPCPVDGRGALAELSPSGQALLGQATVTHDASLRQLLLDRLTPAEAAHLLAIWSRLAGSAADGAQDEPQPCAHHTGDGGLAAEARSTDGKGTQVFHE